jgi:hypothetical protein
MMCALGLGILALQPVYYRTFGSTVFRDFILSTKWALLPGYRRRCRSVVLAAASATAAAALPPPPPPRCRQAAAATAVAFVFIVALSLSSSSFPTLLPPTLLVDC